MPAQPTANYRERRLRSTRMPACASSYAPTPARTRATGSGELGHGCGSTKGDTVNKKKVHRLWKEEGLQVRRAPRRKRAGQSSVPIVAADAPKVVWALDFQFDSTVDGKKVMACSP